MKRKAGIPHYKPLKCGGQHKQCYAMVLSEKTHNLPSCPETFGQFTLFSSQAYIQ
jgi:hypothetical protein